MDLDLTVCPDFLPWLLTPCYLHSHRKHHIYDLAKQNLYPRAPFHKYLAALPKWLRNPFFNSCLSISGILAMSSASPSSILKMHNLTLCVLSVQTSEKPGNKTEREGTRQKGGRQRTQRTLHPPRSSHSSCTPGYLLGAANV